MSLLPSPPLLLPPPLLHEVVHQLRIATVGRYLSVAGLVALLYDHVLTLDSEIRLIWTAPRSFAKWMFLINRYISEVCLLAVANEMSPFRGLVYSNERCQKLIITVFAYGTFSILTNNLLVFLRGAVLWDRAPRVVLGLCITLAVCSLTSFGCTITTIAILGSSIEYSQIAQMCFLAETGPSPILVWAAPVVFEFAVLSLATYNALSRPRSSKTPLMRVLHRDGMLFFVVVTLLHTTNLVFVSLTTPGLIGLPIFFSWAMGTMATNRLLIHLRSSEKGADSECECDVREDVIPFKRLQSLSVRA